MSLNVTIDWKLVAAFGASAVGIILASKMDTHSVDNVSTQAVYALRDVAIAANDAC